MSDYVHKISPESLAVLEERLARMLEHLKELAVFGDKPIEWVRGGAAIISTVSAAAKAELEADEIEDEKKRAAANAEASIEKLEDVGAWILGDAGAEPDGL